MKTIKFFLLLMLVLTINKTSAKGPDININFFYSSLSPYGEWIDFDDDIIVWRPMHVDRDWKPYMFGSWRWTNRGWYWDSDEPFGWATYHYGRWHYDDYYGWLWFPDYEWAPSWVEWRYSDIYIGWAPLSPYAKFRVGFGIHFNFDFHFGHRHWHFVKMRHFHNHGIHNYCIDNRYNRRIYDDTKYRNDYRDRDGYIYNNGVDRNYIERRTGIRIAETRIRETNDRDQYTGSRERNRDEIVSYRPSDKEFERTERSRDVEIRKGDRNLSIERDKIATTRNRDNDIRSRNEELRNRDTEVRPDEKESKIIRKRDYENRDNNDERIMKNRDENSRSVENNRNNERERNNVIIRERNNNSNSGETGRSRRENYERPVENKSDVNRNNQPEIKREHSRNSDTAPQRRNDNESRSSSSSSRETRTRR